MATASNGSNNTQDHTSSTKDVALEKIENLGENPIALLAGGIAVGVLVGLVVPRLAKERELLNPLGRTLVDRATAAAQAARDAGRQEIDALLPNKDDAKEKVSALFGNVVSAAKEAART